MPIYEFVCQECGHEFEHIQSFSDVSAPACANCGSSNVERRLGRPAIHFKGSGWYITDSKKAKKENVNSANGSADANASSSPDGDGGEKSETKSESTSEAKSETKSESSKESTPTVKTD